MTRKWYNWPAAGLLGVAVAMAVLLVLAMIYEVFARYALNAPTLWAFDISYMLNGALFILGCAYALKEEAHVRIDFLANLLAPVWQRRLNAAFYLVLLTPALGSLTWVALQRALHAFTSGEVEHVSPWAPLMWPFYGALALGLAALTFHVMLDAVLFLQNRKHPGRKES